MKRPSGSNADEWHLFLCEYLDNRATGSGDGLGFIAVQIAEAIDDRLRDVAKLAAAVLLFHRGGPWTNTDRATWRGLTGQDEATTKALCDLARGITEVRQAP